MRKSGFLVIACAAIALLGFGNAIDYFRAAPSDLRHVHGAVTSKQCVKGRRGSIAIVEFELAGSMEMYRYPDNLPRARELCERMNLGTEVALLYATPGKPRLWAVSMGGQPFVTLEEAKSAQSRQAWWWLALGIVFMLGGAKVWIRHGFHQNI